MAPATERRNSPLSSFLATRKNTYSFQSSPIYHSFLFCCDRFREVFKIPDFAAYDFDIALQLEAENYRAGSKAIHSSDILVKLFLCLVKPFSKGSVNIANYNEALHNLFERKLVSENRPNPLGNSPQTANIHTLPNEVKIYLLDFLINLRIQKDESEAVDKYCEASALRVLEIGMDSSFNSYFYFGDFRVAVELKKPVTYPHHLDCHYLTNAPWAVYYEEYVKNCKFLIAAEQEAQWTALCESMEESGGNEKIMAKAVRNLFNHELDSHLEAVNRRETQKLEEYRAMQKHEVKMRKEFGIVRTSGRLQVKELERKQREGEKRKIKEEQERIAMDRAIANGTRLPSHFSAKAMTREERRAHREALQAERMYKEYSVIQGQDSPRSFSQASTSQEESSNMENYESSLSSISSFSSLKRPLPSMDGSEDYDECTESKKMKEEEVKEEERSASEQEEEDKYDALPFCAKPAYLCHLTMERYYGLFAPRDKIREQQDYRMALQTAQVLFASEVRQTLSKLKARNEEWKEIQNMLEKLEDPNGMHSRMCLVHQMELLTSSAKENPEKCHLVRAMLKFAEMSWDHLFPETSDEDIAAKTIMRQLQELVTKMEPSNPMT